MIVVAVPIKDLAGVKQRLASVLDGEVPVCVDRGGDRGVPQALLHRLHPGASAQQPGGIGVAILVGLKADPGPFPEP